MGDFDDLIPKRGGGDFDDLVPAKPRPRRPAAKPESYNPTDGMGQYERYRAGLGKSLVDTARGAKQALTSGWLGQAGVADKALRAVGADGAANLLTGAVGRPLAESARRQQMQTAENRRLDAPLTDTTAGMFGNIVGTAAQAFGPGMALRGSAAAPLFLPRTVAGNAAQGAALGGMQPVANEGERGLNLLAGGAAGALPGVVTGAARTAKAAIVDPFTRAGNERIVARTLQRAATDPNRLAAAAPSAIPGVQRTLAEETLDPGVAQLQRQFPAEMAEAGARNNSARTEAIRQTFRGADEDSARALETARDRAAGVSLRGLRSAPVPDVAPIAKGIEALTTRATGRPAVQQALQYVGQQLENVRTAEQAYNVRKTIGDLMEGKLGGDMASARAARRELMTVRDLLDRQMRQAFPDWGTYLRGYRAASGEADQARIGAKLLEAGRQAVNPVTGERQLTPAAVSRYANNPDALARAGTGFGRATAARSMAPEQRNLLTGLGDDMARIDFADSFGKAKGSDTVQNLVTQNVLEQGLGGGRLGALLGETGVGKSVATVLEKTYGITGAPKRLEGVLLEALTNPAEARRIVGRLPDNDRRLVERALLRSGVLAPTLAE